ncbi:hypothetical protein JZ751_029832, partial [Albula glossodonta]
MEAGAVTSLRAAQPAPVQFVDDHRAELIQRVSLVEPIADALKPLIQDEAYSMICAENTSQKQMRMLYRFLDSGGPIVKSAFYTVLFQKEKLLVRDLEQKTQKATEMEAGAVTSLRGE